MVNLPNVFFFIWQVFLVIEKVTGQRMACKMFDLTSIMDSAEKTKKV